MHITITGDLGSGKTTVAKEISKKLNFEYFSTGNIQRALAAEKGMQTLAFNVEAEKDAYIDKHIDDQLIGLNNSSQKYIIDSRLGWHFLKNAFKIYLKVDPMIAASRVMKDSNRKNEFIHKNIEDEANLLLERKSLENERFKDKYGIDCGDMKNYDLIVDSSDKSIEDIIHCIIKKYLDLNIVIIPYQSTYQQYFIDLNVEWINTYFKIEAHDIELLYDHQANILDKGGQIFFARLNDQILGTVALVNEGDGVYELAKMGVLPKFHNFGIGKKLAIHLIQQAKKLGCKKIIVISNTILVPALQLYKNLGFVEVPLNVYNYERANFMAELLISK